MSHECSTSSISHVNSMAGKEMVQAQMEQWMAGCKCSAHQSNLEWACELIEIPQPVTDEVSVTCAAVAAIDSSSSCGCVDLFFH